MDQFIEANKESVVLASLQRSLQTDMSYKLSKNYPNISKQIVEISPNPAGALATPEGREVIFQLPRYGIMTDLLVKSAMTGTGTNSTVITGTTGVLRSEPTPGGLALFNVMELRSHNRVICSNSDSYLRVYADSVANNRGLAIKARSRLFSSDGVTLASAWANGNVVVTYTPFVCTFFDNPRNYLDLNFIEQLQFRIVWNQDAQIGLPGAIASVTQTLWMFYYNMQSDQLAALRAQNFKPETPLPMLSRDCYVETGQITDSSTSLTLSLKNNNATFATHVFLRDRNTAEYYSITSYSFQAGGKTIYNVVPNPVATWEADKWGGAGLLEFDQVSANSSTTKPFVGMQPFTKRPISIFWGLDGTDKTYNSGAVAFHNISNPTLVLSFASTTSIDYYVVHEYFNLCTINPADGVISVSAST